MNYPIWWQRLVAAIIDGVILGVIYTVLSGILLSGVTTMSAARTMVLVLTILFTVITVAYKVFFEGGSWQATPGKMVFGLKLVDGGGNRAPMKQVVMRTWPWWLNILGILGMFGMSGMAVNLIITVIVIGIFLTFFMDPVGRCLHDQTADCNVIKVEKGAAA